MPVDILLALRSSKCYNGIRNMNLHNLGAAHVVGYTGHPLSRVGGLTPPTQWLAGTNLKLYAKEVDKDWERKQRGKPDQDDDPEEFIILRYMLERLIALIDIKTAGAWGTTTTIDGENLDRNTSIGGSLELCF